MATVPIIDLPSQGLNPASPTAFAAPGVEPVKDYRGEQLQKLGAATEKAGTAAMQIGQRIQNEADDAYSKEVYSVTADKFDAVENKYTNMVGKQAFDSTPAALEEMQKAAQDALGAAQTPMQKQMIQNAINVRMRSGVSMINRHSLQQLKVYNTGETSAALDGKVRDAIKNKDSYKDTDEAGNDFGFYHTFSGSAEQDAIKLAGLKYGATPDSETAKNLVMATKTAIADGVIRSFIAEDKSPQAREYLDYATKKGMISPDKLDDLQSLVKTAGVKDESLRLSMSIGGGLNQQIATLKTKFDKGEISADVYDATRQRVEHNWQMRKQQENEGNTATMGSFQDWIIKNPGKPIVDAPPELYSWAKKTGHLAGLDGFAQREGKPAERQVELKLRGELLNQATNDPDAFIATFRENGFTSKLELGTQGIREMQNMATDMINNNGKFKSVFDPKLLQDAIPKDLLKPANRDKKDAFNAIMAEEQAKWRKDNPGRAPDAAAFEQVVKAANAEWVQIGSVWNSKMPAYEARGKAGSMPKSFYDGMKAAGATDAEINAAWAIQKGTK